MPYLLSFIRKENFARFANFWPNLCKLFVVCHLFFFCYKLYSLWVSRQRAHKWLAILAIGESIPEEKKRSIRGTGITRPTLLWLPANGCNVACCCATPAFAGYRTIEMMGLVAPKLWSVSNNTQQVPTLLWFHAKGCNMLGPTMLHVVGQQYRVCLHGPLRTCYMYVNHLKLCSTRRHLFFAVNNSTRCGCSITVRSWKPVFLTRRRCPRQEEQVLYLSFIRTFISWIHRAEKAVRLWYNYVTILTYTPFEKTQSETCSVHRWVSFAYFHKIYSIYMLFLRTSKFGGLNWKNKIETKHWKTKCLAANNRHVLYGCI